MLGNFLKSGVAISILVVLDARFLGHYANTLLSRLHPFMLHSRVNNKLRNVRIVTNNRFPLKEPFQYDRSDPSRYSLIERATLKALGRENLKGWHITGNRERLTPQHNKRGSQKAEREAERARLAEELGHPHDFKLF